MKALRILLVNAEGTDLSRGGAERYVARLAAGLEARGADVRVLSAFPGASTLPADRTVVLHERGWRDARMRRLRNHAGDIVSRPSPKLRRSLEWARPDVVHTNNLPGISTAIWEASRAAAIPVVHTVHDYHLLCPRVTLLRANGVRCQPHPMLCGLRRRRLARWAGAVSHVIGVSRHVLARHADVFTHARLEVIRHPFATPSRPAARRSPQLGTIGYIGALEREKGIVELLDAARELARMGIQIRIAGSGRMRARVEEAAARRPTLDYVGHVEGVEKDAFLAACDAGIVPSIWEEPGGPPYTVLEWLAAGKPVLLSRRGGLVECELKGAIWIEPTPERIAAAARRLRAPDTWRIAQKRVSPPTATETDRWLDEHERIYDEALRACRRP
jgi:glycosyltransferase involved in cell wall biosynthesis